MSTALGMSPWDIARGSDIEGGGFVDANPSLGTAGPLVKFINEAGAEKTPLHLLNTTTQKGVIQSLLPSLYTGGMRRLLQMALLKGENYISNFAYDQFTAAWSNTHGIWISDPIDGFCQRWVISISSAGVFRIPITFKHPLPSNWKTLETAARAMTPEQASAAYGKYWIAGKPKFDEAVKIANAPDIYTAHSGFYSACGWAFNASGSEAVNTGWRIDPADGSNRRKLSGLFKVVISETDGVPTGASSSMLESDYLMNPFRDDIVSGDKAVLQVADSPGICHTFSCWPGASNFGGATETNAPVFAYYDPDDTLQVVRYKYLAGGSGDTVSTGSDVINRTSIGPTTDGTINGSYAMGAARGEIPSAWYTASRTFQPTALFSSLALATSDRSYEAESTDGEYREDGPTAYLDMGSWSISGAAYRVSWHSCDQDHNLEREQSAFSSWRVRCMATGYTKNTTANDETQNNYDVIILHGYDRTSYVHFHYEGNAKRNRIRTRIGTVAAKGSDPIPQLSSDSGSSWASLSVGSLTYTSPEPCNGDFFNVVHNHDGSMYNDCSGVIVTFSTTGVGLGPGTAETHNEPDSFSEDVQMYVVIGSQVLALDGDQFLSDGNLVTDLYLDGATFNYTACASLFVPSRAAYDTYLNATSVATGFGYPACANRLHAFLGFF